MKAHTIFLRYSLGRRMILLKTRDCFNRERNRLKGRQHDMAGLSIGSDFVLGICDTKTAGKLD